MADDAQLLREFVAGSELAFAQLMERHLGLVFSAALRRSGGHAALAEDVTQAVFVLLAQRSGQLRNHASLAGWLYETTLFKVAEAQRSERRRRVREHAAYLMHQLLADSHATAWETIRPVLDDAMLDLNRADREAVLLRFLEGLPFPDIAVRLTLTEATARKRVERALEKLRCTLARRGVVSTAGALAAGALAAVLGAQSAVAVPAGLANTVVTAVSGAAGYAPAGPLLGAISFMTTTQKIMVAAAMIAVCASGGAYFYGKSARELIVERQGLQRQLATIQGQMQTATAASPPVASELSRDRSLRSTTSAANSGATPAPGKTSTAAIEAEQMRHFLSVEWTKLAGGALPLVEKLGLTADQLARYSALAGRELDGAYPPGPLAIDRYRGALQERWANETQDILGAERFHQLQSLQTAAAAVTPVADYLAYWDHGLTGQQGNQMLQLFAANESRLRTSGGELPADLVAQAQQVLSPQQIELWRRFNGLTDTKRQLTDRLRAKETATNP